MVKTYAGSYCGPKNHFLTLKTKNSETKNWSVVLAVNAVPGKIEYAVWLENAEGALQSGAYALVLEDALAEYNKRK